MDSVFILWHGVGDGEFIVSVHKSFNEAKNAGDEHLNIPPRNKYIRIEEWGFDNQAMLKCWDKATYDNPEHSFDWKHV